MAEGKAIFIKIKQKAQQWLGEQTRISLWGNSWIALALNVLLIVFLFSIVVIVFFYIHLPRTTNHGEQHYVPNLVGMHADEVPSFLEARNFRHAFADTSYNPNYAPLTVIRQTPLPDAAVKINRRIYVTINAENPPFTEIPNFLGYSTKTAQNELQKARLQIGKITMVPSPDKNAVQEVWYKGTKVSEEALERGFRVPEGAEIDVKVGSGEKRNKRFSVPKVVGRNWEEAEFILLGSGLNVGQVNFVYAPDKTLHEVVRQNPSNEKIALGETVDLWVISHYKEEE